MYVMQEWQIHREVYVVYERNGAAKPKLGTY